MLYSCFPSVNSPNILEVHGRQSEGEKEKQQTHPGTKIHHNIERQKDLSGGLSCLQTESTFFQMLSSSHFIYPLFPIPLSLATFTNNYLLPTYVFLYKLNHFSKSFKPFCHLSSSLPSLFLRTAKHPASKPSMKLALFSGLLSQSKSPYLIYNFFQETPCP